ncbi:MAG: DUF4406 domain-containing protein [Patescibacteria group bacterium]
METHEELLKRLAVGAIERLKQLPHPVVRVCGPLTTGGTTREENQHRLEQAEAILKEKGYTVFDYFKSNDDEAQIIKAGITDWDLVMETYHRPIFEANLLSAAFFLKDWEKSRGATWEHNFISAHTSADIKEFPEEWFGE